MSEPHPPSLYSANLTNSQVIFWGSYFEKTLQYAWTFLATADRNDLTRKSITRIWHWNSMLLLLLLLSRFSLSDSVWPHRRQPTRLPHPWDSPGKNTGVGCHFLFQCMKVKSETEVAQSCPTLPNLAWEIPWRGAQWATVHGVPKSQTIYSNNNW